jgi:indolepyruvate ferredoxin oxidoreductase beta subunit
MSETTLSKDPYNIIITGVGGQGNVMASRVLGDMFVRKGFKVTIGETFNASQRGGTVMSHLRISRKAAWSPQIPRSRADMIVSLEPVEAIRVLAVYGNQKVRFLSNIRPIYPVSVIRGEAAYPALPDLEASVRGLIPGAVFIDATDGAVRLGNAILVNMIMLGAMQGLQILPLEREDFRRAVSRRVPAGQMEVNMQAFDLGGSLIHS